jgi:hypothetical protein
MKSSAGMLGAIELTSMLHQLEVMSRMKPVSNGELESIHCRITSHFAKLCTALEELSWEEAE